MSNPIHIRDHPPPDSSLGSWECWEGEISLDLGLAHPEHCEPEPGVAEDHPPEAVPLSRVQGQVEQLQPPVLVAGWSTLIGPGLSRLCSDWLVLLRQLSYGIKVASMHRKVLLGVA